LIHVPIAWKLAILPERGAGAARASDLTDHSQFPSNTSAVAVPVAGSLSPTAATTSGFRETAQRTSSSLSRRDLPIPEPPLRRRPLAATLNSYSNFAIACLRAIWLSGAAVMLALAVYRAWRFLRFLHIAGDTDAALASRLAALARQTKLPAVPRLVVVQG